MSHRVNVLLSTYNGAKYLAEQLDSLLSQSYKNLIITVRDDGSTDDTLDILMGYAGDNLRIIKENNLGVVGSFLALLQQADDNCEYYAFCDQDDVWLPGKVEVAVEMLQQHDAGQPLLYCSRLEYVDSSLNHLGYSPIPRRIGFGNALVENIAVGCTIVINRKAKDMILERLPIEIVMHDWWFNIVVSAFGVVVYDPKSHIKYRQHQGNTVGATSNVLLNYFRRAKRIFNKGTNYFKIVGDQVEAFRNCFADLLNPHERAIVDSFLNSKRSLWRRVRYVLTLDVWRQSTLDTIILRLLIIFGSY